MEKVGAYSNTPTQESGINEPRRSEGHEGRRKKEEGRVGKLALEFTQLFVVKMQGF
ncbi:hypothetical protein MEN41_18275 [Dolichospermum sp. ST_con]|nr:hypothetical protein [Dolichospermum sp. ST_con]MDD1418032.1 hypothetical protein [Dolichospermum sp. ST_sed1]MDD1425808.1 hypothetical protein [Dolichospermum sp. ST_sed9]MDD1432340.1 hypothetical protein [Dolichospermum sp. ST_sed6]MDD1435740.1 hypothetical protein [Dolichospermum sp. ST_sed10]MDD1441657.1 hypothetical protein [Dolichospermum sp. ST_sed3]MDD1447445.1 hypothetical protein [Dolichospermum sp. ST_sed8]MDD1455777.1 hypothetical protein [Dolichospermum sp. ST_sed7]MDD146161